MINNHEVTTLLDTIIQQLIAFLPTLIVSACIFLLFYLAAVISRVILRKILTRLTDYLPLVELFAKISYITIILMGVITALGTAGINVSALVTSIGLFGFTLGFAFKDLLSNTLAGIMILFYRPFKIGDAINGTGFDGRVAEINLRYTILNNHQHIILVPNATMLNTIVNVSFKS